MTEKTVKRYLPVVVVVLGTLLASYILFSAWQYHGLVPLGNGYEYFWADNGVVLGVDGEAMGKKRFQEMLNQFELDPTCASVISLGPAVDGYRVYRELIVGHVNPPKCENPRYRWQGGEKLGYFIIDMRTDRIHNGLEKRAWLNKLKERGIQTEPKLFKPSIWDEFLGRNKPQ